MVMGEGEKEVLMKGMKDGRRDRKVKRRTIEGKVRRTGRKEKRKDRKRKECRDTKMESGRHIQK